MRNSIARYFGYLRARNPARVLLAMAVSAIGLTAPVVAETQSVFLWNRNFDTAPVNEVLELALAKTQDLYPPATIIRTAAMEQDEALRALSDSRDGIDVLSTASSLQRDRHFLTVQFPLLRGLLGHRICLIRKGEQALFADIATAYDFTRKQLRICQGEHWPDTRILQRNGFTVVTSAHYLPLFDLLKNRECDCFLRGAQEIVPEFSARQSELDIEQHLVLYYPQPGFFYVNRNNPDLATRIELGLLRALDDGSYEALFKQLMTNNLQRLAIRQRTVIQLNNPNPSAANERVQSIDSLWFSR